MKKTIIVTLVLAVLCSFQTPVFATENTDTPVFLQELDMTDVTKIAYFSDGSVAVTTLKTIAQSRATNTKTGKKTTTVYDSNGSVSFTVTNTSTFSYTGSSATCTAISATKSISDSSWTVTTSTFRSGRTGTVNFTGQLKALGVTIKTVSDSISISCSNTGVLS
ncbi:MAG: hypothetical protein IJO14_08775 [Clostridia bacterium]|nr:hypothetical protein [Clostridia bacterium]